MNRAIVMGIAVVLPCPPVTGTETIDMGPFSVDVSPQLSIRLNGKTLISGDRCVSFRGLRPGEPVLVDPATGELTRRDNVFTVTARRGRNSFRREIMVTPDAVHLTYELRVFGYTGGSHLQYDLLSPVDSLDGADYKAWRGLPRGPLETLSGKFDSTNSEPRKYLFQTARYLVMKDFEGACSFDFNPGGPWQGESNYGDQFAATPYHDGTLYHFTKLCTGGRFGGTMRGKTVIRSDAEPYESLHGTEPVAYSRGYPVSMAIDFSKADSHGDYEPCWPGQPVGKPYRWLNAVEVRIVERPVRSALYRDFATAADGQADGVLELVQRSGLYLLTLNVLDTQEETGPFNVSGAGGPLLENVRIGRGTYWFKTVPLRIRDGRTELHFSGGWKIAFLTLQPLLYETEDFIFERPFWNMEMDTLD